MSLKATKSRDKSVLTLAFEDMERERGTRRLSDSNIMNLRRKSTISQYAIRDSAPERLDGSIIEQIMDELSVSGLHDFEKGDAKDVLSRDPSFTNDIIHKFFSIWYYNRTTQKYEKQFQREIEQLIEFQPTALEMAALHRQMSYTTLWPPLHNKRELILSRRLFHPYTREEKRRLQHLLETRFK